MASSENQSKRDLLLGLTSESGIRLWHVVVGIPIFAVAGLLATDVFAFGSLDVREDVSERIVDLMAGYLTLLVVLERAAGGMVNLYYRKSLVDWTLRLSRINDVLSDDDAKTGIVRQVCMREYDRVEMLKTKGFAKGIEAVKEVENKPAEADQYRAYLTLVKHCYEFLHGRLLSHIDNVVSSVVGVAGFILAALGMRLLEEILVVQPTQPQLQSSVFTLVDVVLTGGFLGGGSATISGSLRLAG